MSKHPRNLPLSWLVTVVLSFACAACGPSPERPGRVFLIGIDGASPRVIDPMLDEGKLPNLARIAQEGARGTLRTAKPISSPRIWNTIVTGKVPKKHGILHFSHQDADGKHRLFLSSDRKTHTLWSIASREGLSVSVINFWNTYPPEKVNGVMVSDHLLAKEIEGRELMVGAEATASASVIHPAGWHDRLAGLVGRDQSLTSIGNPFTEDRTLPRWVLRDELTRHYFEDDALTRMALEIERSERPDVTMVLLPGIDRISHFLWGVLEPADLYPESLRPSQRERKGGKRALFTYYEYTDLLIGELLRSSGPEDLVMVLSDHGFEAGQSLGLLTGNHESDAALDGVIFARGPGIAPGSEIADVRIEDITPTLLAWLGLPVAEDMDGRVASFLDGPPPGTIPTWDTSAVELVHAAPSEVEDEIVEQLRGLGYIEDD